MQCLRRVVQAIFSARFGRQVPDWRAIVLPRTDVHITGLPLQADAQRFNKRRHGGRVRTGLALCSLGLARVDRRSSRQPKVRLTPHGVKAAILRSIQFGAGAPHKSVEVGVVQANFDVDLSTLAIDVARATDIVFATDFLPHLHGIAQRAEMKINTEERQAGLLTRADLSVVAQHHAAVACPSARVPQGMVAIRGVRAFACKDHRAVCDGPHRVTIWRLGIHLNVHAAMPFQFVVDRIGRLTRRPSRHAVFHPRFVGCLHISRLENRRADDHVFKLSAFCCCGFGARLAETFSSICRDAAPHSASTWIAAFAATSHPRSRPPPTPCSPPSPSPSPGTAP